MRRSVDPETARYLKRVRAVPALDREEELALARAFLERGDAAAGDRVIASNLRYVVLIALRYRRLGVAVDDLIAQGSVGLVAALRRFDVARGVRFGTYASYWIRAEMLGLALRQRSMVGGGRGALKGTYVFRMRREHGQLLAQLGDDPEVLRILGDRFHKSTEEIAEILQRVDRFDASLDASSDGGSKRPLVERLRDDTTAPPEEVIARSSRSSELARAVAQATSELNARERYIVEHRLLADEEAMLSLSEIGRSFGVSRERARQLEQAVRTKLRARLRPVAMRFDLAKVAA
jgi:RNA polymerase sigma-32 factor